MKKFFLLHLTGEVLVCDDTAMNRMVITEHLSQTGLTAILAENGKIGVDEVIKRHGRNKPFDLIFMDIHMPVMDGMEAAAKINSLGVKTPIIAMTASTEPDEIAAYKTSGMTDYITKPIKAQALWVCLSKYLISDFEEDGLHEMLCAHFVKTGRFAADEIKNAIQAGDTALAHRLAHTLKGNAGQIGETDLQNTAGLVEALLKKNKAVPAETMEALFCALAKAIKNCLTYLPESKAVNPVYLHEKKSIIKILETLEPLLAARNTDCLHMLNEIRSIPGASELTEQIEDFNFKEAWDAFQILKGKWM
jgi:CheY-like chemotaxis protein